MADEHPQLRRPALLIFMRGQEESYSDGKCRSIRAAKPALMLALADEFQVHFMPLWMLWAGGVLLKRPELTNENA